MIDKFHYLMICLCAFAAISFASCGSDDDEVSDNGNGNSKSLVGTWRADDSLEDDYLEYTFTADGKVTEVIYQLSYRFDDRYEYLKSSFIGTYLLSGDELVMNFTKCINEFKRYDYYDYEDNEYPNMQFFENTESVPWGYSESRTFVTLTNKAFMWKYKNVTESGDVMTRTKSFTKK